MLLCRLCQETMSLRITEGEEQVWQVCTTSWYHGTLIVNFSGEDIRKMEENYNQAQQQWVDNMVNACQVCG